MASNPLRSIRIPMPEYKDSPALKNKDIERMYGAITSGSKNSLMFKRDTVMVSLLFFCGLRKGELISLRVMDIDLEKGLLTVRGETSKSKKTRVLPIHPTLRLHLKEYLEERIKSGYKTEKLIVSTNEDKELSRDGLKHWVNKMIKNSGVKFHLHCIRHTFACNLAAKDVGPAKIQKLMGHADIKMTMTYLRSISSEDLRDDINKLCI